MNITLWYQIVRNFSYTFFRLFHRLQIEGLENIPQGGCIIASNHVSFYDPPLIGCGIPWDCYYLARKTLFVPPVMDKLLPSINAIPVDQDNPDMVGLKRIIRIINEGNTVILFPEGSRSETGAIENAEPGVGLVIRKCNVPVVPTRVFGVHEAWPPKEKFPRLFKPTKVVFGKPMTFSHLKGKPRNLYQQIGNDIVEAIREIKSD